MKPFFRLLAVALLVTAWLPIHPAAAAKIKVTFLLVNDIYRMRGQLMPDGQERGGFARLATVVKAERASGRHVIVAHGGDTLSPSLMSSLDHGAHIIALTNMIRPDIFVPGNHEFDFGKATFLQRMAEANFPIYAANLRQADGSALPSIRDRAIVDFDGVRIGMTGEAYDTTPAVSSSEDLKFLPTPATAEAQADELRREGADFVVAVVHAKRKDTLAMMSSRKIDLVLSGHNHDLFVEFDGRNAVAESSSDAHYLTAVDVTIDVSEQDGRRRTAWWPQFRIIDTATVAPDPEIAALVTKYQSELSRQMDAPIATAAMALDSRRAAVRTQETTIGDLIADAMRISGKADVAIMNGGGIRGGRLYPSGTTITRRDVMAELPFDNRLVILSVTGRDLRAALENGLSQLPSASGRFPQVSGIKLVADTSRPVGNRILSLEVGGVPAEGSRIYRLATNDFLARGSDGYAVFRNGKASLPFSDSPPLANVVINYLHRLGTVSTITGGRISLH